MITGFNEIKERYGVEVLQTQEIFGTDNSSTFDEEEAAQIEIPKEAIILEAARIISNNANDENATLLKQMIQNSTNEHVRGRLDVNNLSPDLKEFFKLTHSRLNETQFSSIHIDNLLQLAFGSQLQKPKCIVDLIDDVSQNPPLTLFLLSKFKDKLLFNENDNSFYDFLASKIFGENSTEKNKDLTGVVSQILSPKFSNDENVQKAIFNKLFNTAFNSYNASLLHHLKDNYPEQFVNCSSNLNPVQSQLLNRILDHNNPAFFTKHMLQFSNGFGHIEYEGGLITTAQIQSRKSERKDNPYSFNPTVLKEGEFLKYLQTVKQIDPALLPATERFILTGSHWLSGQVKIDKNGNAELLLIDSLGRTFDGFTPTLAQQSEVAVRDFTKVFPKTAGTDHKVYFDNTTRQVTRKGCSVYSLDDAQHLYTTEQYLPEKYANRGLSGYLADHKHSEGKWRVGSYDVTLTKLPLSMMRTAQIDQFPKLTQTSVYQDEKSTKLNKKGQTAADAIAQDSVYKESAGKNMNRRLERKLSQMVEKNAEYLFTHDESKIKHQMQSFTLAAFEQRVKIKAPKEEAHLSSVQSQSRIQPVVFSNTRGISEPLRSHLAPRNLEVSERETTPPLKPPNKI